MVERKEVPQSQPPEKYFIAREADELSKTRNYSRDFALYVMYRQAITAGDKARAEACMDLLEREVMNALADPVFWG